MPHVNFGTKDEPGFDLEESAELIAVRTRSRRSIAGTAEVADGTLIAAFPDAGVEVYQVPTKARPLDERKQNLRRTPDIQFAGSVLVHPGVREPVLYTENIYVRFREGIDRDECEEAIRAAGLTVKERLDHATNAYFASAPAGTGQRIFEIAQELLGRDDVLYCHPELIQRPRRNGKD